MRVGELSPGPPIAHLTPFKRNGEVIGYVTNLGLGGDGKRRRRFFKDRDQAEQFLNEHAKAELLIRDTPDRYQVSLLREGRKLRERKE